MYDHDKAIDNATDLGLTAGYNQASWVFDGNTDRETYENVRTWIEDGDPALDDFAHFEAFEDAGAQQDLLEDCGLEEPDDFVGNMNPRLGDQLWDQYNWRKSELIEAFETAGEKAFQDELERVIEVQFS